MPTHAAFLRGVNLGANRRVSNDRLREILEGLGFDEVTPFRSSGNVVFAAAGRESVAKLTDRIERGLAEALGFEVIVFVRTAGELRAIAAHEPFPPAAVEASKGKIQVSILAGRPTAAKRKRALAMATDDDRLAFGERELYWLPSGGMMEAGIDVDALDELVGPMTRRTMGTIEQMASKFFAD
jgi:uncharacterized protein (DUF1697 family)